MDGTSIGKLSTYHEAFKPLFSDRDKRYKIDISVPKREKMVRKKPEKIERER